MARMFTGAGSIYADPAFQMGMALGNAYGNLWAHNAKERQKVKADNLYNEMFGGDNSGNEIAQIAAMGNAGAGTANTVTDPDEARRQRLTNEVVMGGQTPQQIAASITGNIPGSNAAAANANATNNALDYIQQQQQLNGLSGNRAAAQNPLISVDDFISRAKSAGINQEVIDERLPELRKEAARRARENLLPGITNNLYGYTNADGEYVPPNYAQAIQDIVLLGEYDPETAKTLMSGAISPKDVYNAQREDRARALTQQGRIDTLKAEYELKEQLKDKETQKAVNNLVKYGGMTQDEAMRYVLYGNITRGKGKSGSAKSLLSSEDFKYANETLAAYDEKIAMANGDLNALTPEEQADYNRLSAYKEYALNQTYGTPASSGNTDLIAMTNSALSQGATEQQILDELKNQRGYGENTAEYQLVAKYLKGRRSDNTRPQRLQQQEEPQQQERASESSLFDFSLPSLSPTSPLLQTDENGMPRWANEANKRGLWAVLAEAGDMNRGANGLPWFMQK